MMTEGGLIKRIPSSSFRTQKRNGKGVKTQDDITHAVIRTNTIDSLMVFTDKGKMYRLLVNDIPVGTNVSKGTSIKSLINMDMDEQPAVMYSIYRDTDATYVLFITKNGLVKKTNLDEYIKTKKKTGIAAITIKEGDELAAVSLIKDEQLIITTANGMAIRFDSKEISPTSRATSGVKGITLADGDSVVSGIPVRNAKDKLAVFVAGGSAKRIDLSELPLQKRAGKGLMCYKPTDSTGKVSAATLVEDGDCVLVIGDKGSICIEATEIPVLGRASIGNQVIKNSKIMSVSKV
jgi:DNA gyrase subunit A